MPGSSWDDHARVRLSWPGIVGGAIVALAIAWALSALAVGIGLSAIEPRLGDFGTRGGVVGSIVWTVLAVAVGSFFGGWVSVRASPLFRPISAGLQAIVTWALGFVVTAILVLSVSRTVTRGVVVLAGEPRGVDRAEATREGAVGREIEDRVADAGAALGWATFLSGIAGLAATIGGAALATRRPEEPDEPVRARRTEGFPTPPIVSP